VLDRLEGGDPVSVHHGGASRTEMSTGPDRIGIPDVLALDNRRALTHLLALGSFTHDITSDCIGEAFLRSPGGAVAALGTSSLGFVALGMAGMKEWFRLWTSEEATTAGALSALSRGVLPHDQALAQILLGDPQLEIVPASAHPRARGALPAAGAGGESGLAPAARLAAWPNPARDRVSIGFDLPGGGWGAAVEVAIFDLNGRRVRTLTRSTSAPPRFEASWNLRDDAGRRVRDGVYFVSARLGGRVGRVQVQRLVVVR
jgi:hypothetical protein